MPSELINVEHPFYVSPSVHKEMLDDVVRTVAFRNALAELLAENNNASVLDIGTGTGILAMSAAQLGAKKVFASEIAGAIFDATNKTIQANGFEEKVALLKYDSEQKLPLPHKVDIIVSECLGHFGFDENMIQAVSSCNEYLKPNGKFLPESVTLFAALTCAPSIYNDCIDVWNDSRYGIDFSVMRTLALNNIYVKTFETDAIISEQAKLISYQLGEPCGILNGRMRIVASADGMVNGLAGWFESKLSENITLSTSPYAETTHWEQVFMPIASPFFVSKGMAIDIDLMVDNHTESNKVTFSWTIYNPETQTSYKGSATI